MKNKLIIFLVLIIIFSIPCFGQSDKLKIKKKDKSEIIEAILTKFFEDYPDEVDSQEIILSSLNIDSFSFLKKNGKKLILLNSKAIAEKANRESVVSYLVFSEFKSKGSKVLVKLENLSAKNVESKLESIFGNGFYWEAERKSGKWLVKCVNTSAFTANLVKTDSIDKK